MLAEWLLNYKRDNQQKPFEYNLFSSTASFSGSLKRIMSGNLIHLEYE